MIYRDGRGFIDSFDNQKDFNEKFLDVNPGPYVAVVKITQDPERMGRLGVNIPALTGTDDPHPKQLTWCNYLSPFYGAKSVRANSQTDVYNYDGSQHSYGMWAVPPDIDTSVLVIFAKGDQNRLSAYWIGCVQEPGTNQQVPAHGSTKDTAQAAGGNDLATQTKQEQYGTDQLPAGERNRIMQLDVNLDQQKFPINTELADQLTSEGLIQDTARGTITSSARREAPSQVFGISTPGRVKPDSREPRIGLDGRPVKTDRTHGHSFVMDDGAQDGTNQLVRIRTTSGHQIMMNDSEGTVYISNGSGKSFIEMEKDGTINMYSKAGINMRTGGDFNLHSDKDITFHAKSKIKFTAEQHVALNAEKYVYVMGQSGILAASQSGAVRHYARDGISSYTNGTQLHGAAGRIDLAGSEVHFNSVGARRSWGPSWLKPDHARIGIKVGQNNDIVAEKPFQNGKKNTKKTKSTIKQNKFVTHEPYDRK